MQLIGYKNGLIEICKTQRH